MVTESSLRDQARQRGAREADLAVVVTMRPDRSMQASVVNAGIVTHPVTGTRLVGFMVQGSARSTLRHLRAMPNTTVVFWSGWDWVTIEGDVDLVGPDDLLMGLRPERLLALFHEIYAAAIGGSPG